MVYELFMSGFAALIQSLSVAFARAPMMQDRTVQIALAADNAISQIDGWYGGRNFAEVRPRPTGMIGCRRVRSRS
jgi:hypothetical protein